jgi:hypothetical protein
LIKGIKKYGKADRRCDLGNLIVVWGMMPLLMAGPSSHVGHPISPCFYALIAHLAHPILSTDGPATPTEESA